VGHFGLAYEAYTHFTSPIRRYPDLLVHRCIKAVLAGQQYKPGDWGELGMHASQTERRADEATRDVVNWLKCYYMKDRVGETAAGTISAVTSFGVFVALDDVFVEGLVHISDLGSDYFHFEPAAHELRGERTGQRFRLGDRLWVTVARVDLETSRIDFVLASRPALPLSEPELPTMPHVLPPGVVPKVKPAGKPRDIDKKALAAESDRATLIASARKVREARAGGTNRKGAPKTRAKQREQ